MPPIKKDEKSVKKSLLPLNTYAVMLPERAACIYIEAMTAKYDGELLEFLNIYSVGPDEDEIEEVVAMFKEWVYYINEDRATVLEPE